MSNILITGATGLLGSGLLPHLKKCGHNVLTHGYSKQANFMFDLSNEIDSFKILEKVKPNVIINLVGLTSVELCEKQLSLAYLLNTRSVENLASWICKSGAICHLIHISTDQVYDGNGLHTENEINITNNYAFSKYAGELAAIQVTSTILRTNFFGLSRTSHRLSFTDWIYKSIKNSQQIEVLKDVFFTPLSITFLAEMIELILQKKPLGIYNLGSHNAMSKADFAFSFADFLYLNTNFLKPIASCDAKFLQVYRPKNMSMDSSKFEKALGIKLPNLSDLIQEVSKEYNSSI